MGLEVWNGAGLGDVADRLETWRNAAGPHDRVVVLGLSGDQLTDVSQRLGAEAAAVYHGASGNAAEWLSRAAAAFHERQQREHQELLLILQEALITIAETDKDLASRLAARAYVHLKTDPKGQRRYDGLLHRFTGVLHQNHLRPSLQNPPARDGGSGLQSR